MKKVLQLTGIAAGDRDATTTRVRDAFSEVGAWITDVHFFAGVQTVFTFEVAPDGLRALADALVRAGLEFEDASRVAIDEAVAHQATEDLDGTLAVFFAHGDPDLKHEVPAVDG